MGAQLGHFVKTCSILQPQIKILHHAIQILHFRAGSDEKTEIVQRAMPQKIDKYYPYATYCVRTDVFDNSIVEPIELRMIRPSKFPVRYHDPKDSPDMASLKSSIREHGLLQPIVVRPLEQGFEIVAGHRRFAACRSLRWRFVPCRICELTDRHAYEIQLTENLQRKTMDPMEEAEAYQRYVVDFGWGGVSDLGRKIGKSEEYVSHRMQLLKLPDHVKEKVAGSSLGISQALEITGIDPSRTELIDAIADGKMTVRQIRQAKRQLRTEQDAGADAPARSKEDQIVRKSSLALKLALSRIDALIEDAHGASARERTRLVKLLMDLRHRTHSMIDDTLRYKKARTQRR